MVDQTVLDDEDFATIDAALESIAGVRENIARAKSAGLDVTEREKKLSESEGKLTAIRNAFKAPG